MAHTTPALELLKEHYPSRMLISLADCAQWIGIAAGTARNYLARGDFPIPTRKFGDLRLVDIRDLAAWLDAGEVKQDEIKIDEVDLSIPRPAVKRKAGRPPKRRSAA